jgi:hypothetical protein
MDIRSDPLVISGERRGSRDARRHTNQQGNLSSVKYCVLTLAAMRWSMTFSGETRYWHNARVT